MECFNSSVDHFGIRSRIDDQKMRKCEDDGQSLEFRSTFWPLTLIAYNRQHEKFHLVFVHDIVGKDF